MNNQNLNHSCSHLLAAAIQKLYPDALPTLGPAIEDGFYYDFDNLTISEDNFSKIEKEMKNIVKNWNNFEEIKVTPQEAKNQFKDNQYKLELIEEHAGKGEKITLYKSGDFTDLCAGGHIDDPQKIKHFKLLSTAGAYWRGSEKNKMLTRIYGVCFPTEEELITHLENLKKAKERDHRKLGKDLDLFTFSDLVGKGLPLFTEKGATILREIERFVVDEEIKRGYKHVKTPELAKTELYKTSGHYPYYKDTMYPPMEIDDDELILRPMTCPHHFELFKSKPRSYKDLPLRYAEMATLFRYEKSGELTGLMRVRKFTLADSHNFVRKENATEEINFVLDLIEDIAKVFGLEKEKNYTYRLSLSDQNKDKYYNSPKDWEFSENLLKNVLTKRNSPFYESKGDAAFYGPKIDIQMKNVLGREDTAFTVQYDFCLPSKFDLSFINEKGEKEQPVVIHRSSIGALERSFAFLIEHFGGAFPTWLSPVQVKILPITENQLAYSEEILKNLLNQNIRAELDNRNETLQNKIRNAQLEKVPYMLTIGAKEQESHTASERGRSGKDYGQIKIDEFIKNIKEEIENKQII